MGIKNITDDGVLDLSTIRHIDPHDYPKWTKRVEPKEGDIVFTYEATLHRYAIIPKGFQGCLGRRMALIRTDETKALGKFLHFAFFGHEWRQTVEANIWSGATVDRIPLTNFPDFPITLPPLPIQRRIAGILSAYDDLIEVNTRRIKALEEMARRTYEEWFVHYRFPGGNGTKPDGWEEVSLKDRMELAYGKALKAEDRIEGNVPVYGSSGIVGWHSMPLVSGEVIILGRKGNVGSVHWSRSDCYPIDTVFFVKTDLPIEFVYHNLLRQSFQNSDAAVPGLNRNQAYSLPLIVPDQATLKAFVDRVRPIHRFADQLQNQNTNLRTQRDLLLPRLVSGAIDVSEAQLPQPVEVAAE